MLEETAGIQAAILAVTLVFLILGAFIVMIMIVYRKRRNTYIIEKLTLQSEFRHELLKTQIEVQEQTLNNISREIHDNISQVLSFVKLNLALTDGLPEPGKQQKVDESRDLIAQAINDLRNLSKSLSFEHIALLGLVKTIEIETERINNSGLIHALLLIEGESYWLGKQRELVLFRICQEALNNTLKHANAKHFKITLQYSETLFTLILEDDGNGFSAERMSDNAGMGLKNMENRAALIGAVAAISSSPGKGCAVKVMLKPTEQTLNANGNYSNSPG